MARETDKYESALPSREHILDILTEHGVPIDPESLLQMLDIGAGEQELFDRRLRAMERDGQIMRNRKGALCLADKLDLIKGRVEGHADGFGFLIPDDGKPDMFLGPKQMQGVLHGDRVMVKQTGVDRRGRPEATIVEVLERVNNRIVGRLYSERGVLFVVAENKRINQDILIEAGGSLSAKAGQVVIAEIVQQPSKHAEPIARIVEVLGNYADPGMEIEIALRKHDLPHEFPSDVESASKKFSPTVGKADVKGRKDVRDLPLVTIDGETARDFDDAVFCELLTEGRSLERSSGTAADKKKVKLSDDGERGREPKGKDFRLVVAIADVSHYVQSKDALDREAYNRGNSVYFPRRVIPMLPEVLSNGLCSLNPEVDRLCVVCDMTITQNGDIKEYEFYPSVMHSKARLTYSKAWAMLQDPHGADAKQYANVLPHVQNLYKLFKVLLKARAKRGAIDFETTETQMIFDDKGKIEKIIPVIRNDAHKLIEECMLAANVSASDFLAKNKQHTLYRVHEGPTDIKLEALREFLKEFGLQLGGGDAPHAKDYAALLEKIKPRPDARLLQTVMLRSLQQAVYSPDNVGHFGLAYEAYAHFTSPIRRYPDLLVHRAIKAVLNGEKYNPAGKWAELGVHCSQTERRADDATRDVEAWLKCYYMQDKLGEEFNGTVSSVTSFGIFVALDDVYVEGLVHISELGTDYFHFDQAKHRLLGERTGRQYRIGDRVKIKIARVDLETTKMDFALVEEKPSKESAPMLPHHVPKLKAAVKKSAKKAAKKTKFK
ncbi:MAG: ribonuclease R [Burkholderiales bacterium]